MQNRSECCGTCKHNQYDWETEDFTCGNPESEYFADWTAFGTVCESWEEKECCTKN